MEEAVAADVVLHVIDGSHPQFEEQRIVGEEVLRSLGIPNEKIIAVYNKADLVAHKEGVAVSALTGRGIEQLIEVIRDRELAGGEVLELDIPHDQSRVLARLHDLADVYEERAGDDSTRVTAWVPQNAAHNFVKFLAPNLLKRAKVS